MPSQHESGPGGEIADLVRRKGITDLRVLSALARLDRRRFLPPDQRAQATIDRALPIGLAQTISQPFIVAVMTSELNLSGTERVLEIGTGSGYQTAILAHLSEHVFTIERHSLLSMRARSLLDGLRIENVSFRVGDGSLGWPDQAPFERILVAASAPEVPRVLFSQLAEGGILIAPLGPEADQYLTVIRKQGNEAHCRKVLACRFVRMIGEGGWRSESSL